MINKLFTLLYAFVGLLFFLTSQALAMEQIAPEPVSTTLFLTGSGVLFVAARLRGKIKK
ncbi:MAG TPA: hypothetical protein PLF03_05970 [Candidatus Omnitrophota bacterium]|nr:hypothetical protein [Candidatus Omnitrophota bacterium]